MHRRCRQERFAKPVFCPQRVRQSEDRCAAEFALLAGQCVKAQGLGFTATILLAPRLLGYLKLNGNRFSTKP
jgi:hypothetical protein